MKKWLALSAVLMMLGTSTHARATDVVKRLRVTPWTGSRTVDGVVDGAKSTEPLTGGADRYIVRAHRGERLDIAGVSDSPTIVRVWDKKYDRGVIFTEQASEVKADILVPRDGDYIILVSPAPGVSRFQYHYTIKVR